VLGRDRVKRLLVLLVGVAMGVPCSLAAASALQGTNAGKLGNGAATVSACDTDGFTITYTTVGGNVTSVAVGGIAAQCNGGTLKLTVVDGSRTSVASGGPVTVSGSSATVSVSPNPAGSVPAGVDVSISGP
jgi:hypothetical protein